MTSDHIPGDVNLFRWFYCFAGPWHSLAVVCVELVVFLLEVRHAHAWV